MSQQNTEERCDDWSYLGLAVGSITGMALTGSFIAMFGYQLARGISRIFFG